MQKRINSALFVILLFLSMIGIPHASGQSLDWIDWHNCVKTNSVFAWKMTSVDLINDEQEWFLKDLLIQIKYIANPPNDPSRVLNTTEPPDWVNVYINRFRIELDQMGEIGSLFTQLISPIRYHFDNGTSFTLEEIHRLAKPIEGLDSYFTVENGYVNATIGNDTMRYTTFTNIETGIAANISIFTEEMGSLLLKYYVKAANVNIDGESTDIEDEYTKLQEDPPSFYGSTIIVAAVIIASVVLILAMYIVYRRKT